MHALPNRKMAWLRFRDARQQLERASLDQPSDLEGRSVAVLVAEEFFFPHECNAVEIFEHYPYLKETFIMAVTERPVTDMSEWGSDIVYKSEAAADYILNGFYSLAMEYIESLSDSCESDREMEHYERFGDAYATSSEELYWATDDIVRRLANLEDNLSRRHPDVWVPGRMAVQHFHDGGDTYRIVYYRYRGSEAL